jgi:hypothetical protein
VGIVTDQAGSYLVYGTILAGWIYLAVKGFS